MLPSSPSPLLRIPGEIRNQIFENLVVFSKPVQIYRESQHSISDDEPPSEPPLSATLTSLFLTCRQIRAEASAMFYSRNTFALPANASQAPHQIQANLLFRWFLDRVGPHNAARIRHLAVPFPVEPSAFIHSHLSAAAASSGSSTISTSARISDIAGEGCDKQIIPALRQRCPNLESISFDLSWNNHWVRLLAPNTTTAQAMFGRLDEELRESFPSLKRVGMTLPGPGRTWTFTGREVRTAVEMPEEEWAWARGVIEEGHGWTVTIAEGEAPAADNTEGEEEQQEHTLSQQQHTSGWASTWYPREGRQPAAHLWEAPEMAIESEIHDSEQWTRLDELKSRARFAVAWLRSPSKAVQARADAEEWAEWKRTMIAQAGPVGVPLYCLASRDSSIPPPRVPRTERVRRSVRGLFF